MSAKKNLEKFIQATIEDPFLAAEFRDNPDTILKEYNVDEKYWDTLKTRDDVRVFTLLLDD